MGIEVESHDCDVASTERFCGRLPVDQFLRPLFDREPHAIPPFRPFIEMDVPFTAIATAIGISRSINTPKFNIAPIMSENGTLVPVIDIGNLTLKS